MLRARVDSLSGWAWQYPHRGGSNSNLVRYSLILQCPIQTRSTKCLPHVYTKHQISATLYWAYVLCLHVFLSKNRRLTRYEMALNMANRTPIHWRASLPPFIVSEDWMKNKDSILVLIEGWHIMKWSLPFYLFYLKILHIHLYTSIWI